MRLTTLISESLPEFGYVNESSLSRVVYMLRNRDFCIASGFRYGNTMKVNRANNRSILNMLKTNKMGGYVLVGHWQEAPDGVEWSDASPDQLQETVEESILFIRPDTMSIEDFESMAIEICRKFNQDAVILGFSNESVYLYYKNGERSEIGSGVTINRIAQAYSRLRSGNKTPFVFEGSLHPSSNLGKMAFSHNNILYVK